ncbi:MAG: hypothetical protein V4659_03985 [Pseudomonadota bacterium]
MTAPEAVTITFPPREIAGMTDFAARLRVMAVQAGPEGVQMQAADVWDLALVLDQCAALAANCADAMIEASDASEQALSLHRLTSEKADTAIASHRRAQRVILFDIVAITACLFVLIRWAA